MERLFSWEVVGWVVGVIFPLGFGFIALKDYKIAKVCFLIAAADASGGLLMWAIKTENRAWQILLTVFVVIGCIGVLTVLCFWYVDGKKREKGAGNGASPPLTDSAQSSPTPKSPPTPSLLFVFGAPLGDNESASWIMMLKHYGPSTAYNCDIIFYDNDRKNIEHEWLVKHPNSPFPPPGLAGGESQKRIQIVEATSEAAPEKFIWNPLNPNSQHYSVSISCREGVFDERWEVARVNGLLRSSITIEHGVRWRENHPDQDPVVFRCQDPQFVTTALAAEMPTVSVGKIVHPGWKPNYRFQVPSAIIDSNGNVEVLSGVKLPDGSTRTDFGCWNILTKHFGD